MLSPIWKSFYPVDTSPKKNRKEILLKCNKETTHLFGTFIKV